MKKEKVINYFISIVLGLLIGISLYAMNPAMNFSNFLISTGVFMFIFTFFMLVQTVIHELGHLVFGLIYGYSFVSFSLFFITLIKKEGKLRFTKFNHSNIAGQCLMKPKAKNMPLFNTMMYNLGGGMLNIIFSLIFILISLNKVTGYNLLLIRLFYGAGLTMAIMNLVPLKVSGIPNDGYNSLMLNRDSNSLKALNDSLIIYSKIVAGSLYSEIPKEYLYLYNDYDYNNPLLTMILIYKINYFLEIEDYSKAYSLMNDALEGYPDMLSTYYKIIERDKLFFDILNDETLEDLKLKYQNFNEIVDTSIINLDTLKIKIVYNKFILEVEDLYLLNLEKYKTLINTSQFKADQIISKQLLQLILNKVELTKQDNVEIQIVDY